MKSEREWRERPGVRENVGNSRSQPSGHRGAQAAAPHGWPRNDGTAAPYGGNRFYSHVERAFSSELRERTRAPRAFRDFDPIVQRRWHETAVRRERTRSSKERGRSECGAKGDRECRRETWIDR